MSWKDRMRYPTPLPDTFGWGPGYPDCQREKMVPLTIMDRSGGLVTFRAHQLAGPNSFQQVPFVGGVRREIAPLMSLLLTEVDRRGFDFMDPGCWAFACRATKTSSGSHTQTPSFHSWGLAPDINAPRNPFGAKREDTELGTSERWVAPLMAEYGFFWLGPPIGDWMHFSCVLSPREAAVMFEKAKEDFGMDERFTDYLKGQQAYREAFHKKGDKDPGAPPASFNPSERAGWASMAFPIRQAPGKAP